MMRTWEGEGWRDFRPGDLAPDDRGFLVGDGVFETMRVSNGRILYSAEHRDRFEAACAALDLVCPAGWDDVDSAASSLSEDAILRLTLTRGPGPRGIGVVEDPKPRLFVSHAPHIPAPTSMTLQTSAIRRSPASLTTRLKTLSYADNTAARREAVAAGADMALLLTTDGHLSGADCANLFWMAHDTLYTPSQGCAIRPGVMREAVISAASRMQIDVREGAFAPETLRSAGAVFVTNAALGAVPVHAVDGRAIKTGHPGMLRLAEAVATGG